ncbi:Pro-Interleukin-16 [Manis pentadactyla]|nr:Pro-Interleukin-16 [Manis pentadactyla]
MAAGERAGWRGEWKRRLSGRDARETRAQSRTARARRRRRLTGPPARLSAAAPPPLRPQSREKCSPQRRRPSASPSAP